MVTFINHLFWSLGRCLSDLGNPYSSLRAPKDLLCAASNPPTIGCSRGGTAPARNERAPAYMVWT